MLARGCEMGFVGLQAFTFGDFFFYIASTDILDEVVKESRPPWS